MNFNESLKMHRLRIGMTQFELADKLDVSPATISKYEVGRVFPDIYTLIKLSKIFNVSFAIAFLSIFSLLTAFKNMIQ